MAHIDPHMQVFSDLPNLSFHRLSDAQHIHHILRFPIAPDRHYHPCHQQQQAEPRKRDAHKGSNNPQR